MYVYTYICVHVCVYIQEMALVLIRIPCYKQQKLTWANLRVAV